MCRRQSAQLLRSIPFCRTVILYGGILMMSLLSGELAWAQVPATVLHRFTGYSSAVGPRGGLVLAPDGTYYGTRAGGGAFHAGLIFRMTPDGTVTTVYDFRGGEQGGFPDTTLTLGPDGALVGTMSFRSPRDFVYGAFRAARDGSSFEVLHRFDRATEGYVPGRIRLGRDGNFYGTLGYDSTHGHGAVYRMSPAGTVTVLHAFAGAPTGGDRPVALVQAPDGGFFGATAGGGPCNSGRLDYCGTGNGTLFHMTPAGAVTILRAFIGGLTDGAYPTDLILGANGNVLGTTSSGGSGDPYYGGGGTLFEWTSGGEYRVLTLMQRNPTSLMQAGDGTLYGTTYYSDVESCSECGQIFKIAANGTPVYLQSFSNPANGSFPHELIQGSDGALYGTAERGGTSADAYWGGFGTIFRVDRDDTVTQWHRFMGNDEGAIPDAPLVQATDGNFYGTTRYGGIYNRGTVYRMTPNGSVQVLYTFTGGLDGAAPTGIVQASDGFLYGSTVVKGAANQGTIFRLSLAGNFTVIHAFAAPGPIGVSRLVLGANGLLYGTSYAVSGGTIFRATLNGVVTVIHRFSDQDGSNPASLLQAQDGDLYGTTYRGVFRIGPNGGLRMLTTSSWFLSDLVQGPDGNIYALAQCSGQLVRISTGGVQVVTAALGSSCSDWGQPFVGLATDRRGTLLVYGSGVLFRSTFPSEPASNYGRIVAVGIDGTLTLLHQIKDGRDGDTPISLMQASGGRLYVTTAYGGVGGGTILRLDTPFAPRILFSAPAPAGGLTLTWSPELGQTRYTIMRTGGTAGQTMVASGLVGNTFTDSTVVPGVVYSYVIVAVLPSGERSQSTAFTVPWLTPASRTPTVTTIGDYDGDGKADLTVYRGSTGTWFSHRSSDGALATYAWGAPLLQDRPVPADYDGDGVTDVAGYRQTTGEWFIHQSSDGAVVQVGWGSPLHGDVPVPADYDGDGRTDIAGYRTTTGEWLIHQSSDGALVQVGWGSPLHGDVPVPADYDGDGRADLAGYRTTTGEWLIHQSSDGALVQVSWGSPLHGDVPVPADYDGDGRADLAGYRATTGEWLIHRSSDGALVQLSWGSPAHGDVPVVGDYDSDGRADVAIYRALTAEWFIIGSAGAVTATQWGAPALGDAVRFF